MIATARRDFTVRSRETELMDSEAVGLEDYRACLRDLAAVNRLTRGYAPTLGFLARATRGLPKGSALSILDIGFGHGDGLRRMEAWCRRKGFDARLVGIDLNPSSAEIAAGATPAGSRIEYRTGDAFDLDLGSERFDFVVSALMTHHLPDSALARFLGVQERIARRGWFVNDLHRHRIAYHGFTWLSRLARWHRFVQHDGPVSIARGFRREDWERIIAAAGLPREAVRISWHMPFRLCVERLK